MKPGWVCRSHTCCSPAAQAVQDPQAQTNGTVTRVAGQPAAHVGADRLDDARQLVAGDVRQDADVGVVALPAVPVAAAQPRRLDPDHRAVWGGRRVGQLAQVELPTEQVKGNGSHLMSLG